MPGISVSCTLTAPNGTKMSATATTGANGSAAIIFKLKRNAPPGTYQELAVAVVNGISGSGTMKFTVQ
jgi:uncharacterized protein YfaS (alpha-2-macroglobulin family)